MVILNILKLYYKHKFRYIDYTFGDTFYQPHTLRLKSTHTHGAVTLYGTQYILFKSSFIVLVFKCLQI